MQNISDHSQFNLQLVVMNLNNLFSKKFKGKIKIKNRYQHTNGIQLFMNGTSYCALIAVLLAPKISIHSNKEKADTRNRVLLNFKFHFFYL